MENMIIRTVLLVLLWINAHRLVGSSQCRPSQMKVIVRSHRNQTGHWITKLSLDRDVSSSVALEEGQRQTGHWTIDIDHSARGCDLDNDSVSLEATITAPPSLAGPGYELFHGIGRYKFHIAPKTWSEARSACAIEGAHLAIVNSEAESDVLKQLFDLHPLNTMKTSNNNYAFIGFTDMYQEGHYITIFGEPLSQTGFARWSSPTQPDNAGGRENCGSLHRNGGLNDIPCDLKLAFFCEQELW